MKRGRKSEGDLTVVPLTDARIQPPENLTEEQKAEWASVVDSLPADYFRPGDAPLLAAFCVASVLHKRAAQDIELRGMTVVRHKGDEAPNPCHQILNSQGNLMATLAVKLRLCPSARISGKAAERQNGETTRRKRSWEF